MKRHGEEFTLDQGLEEVIVTYMDDEIREKVHFEMAPCTPEEFLRRYIELDPDFEQFLWEEFTIEM